MIRSLILAVIGCIVGYMFIGWSIYMIRQHIRLSPDERAASRVRPWLMGLILLIGVADSYKATMDLIAWFMAP